MPGGDTGRTKLPNPRAPPALSDAEQEADGNGYIRDGRAEGSLGPPPVLASVNLVPLLWTGVPTPSAPADRQDPLPIFRCPGNAFMLRRVLPDHLIINATLLVAVIHIPCVLGISI